MSDNANESKAAKQPEETAPREKRRSRFSITGRNSVSARNSIVALNLRPKLVVLGGGLCGAQLVSRFQASQKFHVTLVDKKRYFENNVASVRAIVRPDFHSAASVDHTAWLHPDTTLVVGDAVDITNNTVVVTRADESETKREDIVVPYDYLIVATGSSYPLLKAAVPLLSQRRAELMGFSDRVKNATNHGVLVIGGGPVGIETAGEIRENFPDVQVTLVHRGSALLDNAPPKAQRKALQLLEAANVRVLLNDEVDLSNDLNKQAEANHADEKSGASRFRTKNGQEISADVVFASTGLSRFNSDSLRPHFGSSLDQRGQVLVNEYLQVVDQQGSVVNQSKIFALGDVVALNEPKLLANGNFHVPVVYDNVMALFQHNSNPNAPAVQDFNGKALGMKVYNGFYKANIAWPVVTIVGSKNSVVALPMMGGVSFKSPKMAKMKNDKFMTVIPKRDSVYTF